MNNDSNIITSVLSGASENRRLEFKEGFNWESQTSAKLRDELIKAIIAMSNTPGGGSIVLGIRTDTKKKKIYPEGFSKKDVESFTKNEEQVKTVVHGFCQRPINIEFQIESHPEDKNKLFLVIQVSEFEKWPTVTVKHSKTKENNDKSPVIEHHAIYTRSKLAQWSSIKAGHQEIEDIVEIAVKKYDKHVRSLGYTKVKPREDEITKWFGRHHDIAIQGLTKKDIKAYLEIKVKFLEPDLEFKKVELRDAARESTIPTFGWPIAVFLDNREDFRPAVEADGIKAEIGIERHSLDGSKTYDYWSIHTSGAFFTLKSLFEDLRDPQIISFNTRIVRITELFMYLKNLYLNLGVDEKKELEVTILHGGIKGRRLGTLSQNRFMLGTYTTSEDLVSTTIQTSIHEFRDNPGNVVEKITEPLFETFDFHRVDRTILDQIVNDYLNGKVT